MQKGNWSRVLALNLPEGSWGHYYSLIYVSLSTITWLYAGTHQHKINLERCQKEDISIDVWFYIFSRTHCDMYYRWVVNKQVFKKNTKYRSAVAGNRTYSLRLVFACLLEADFGKRLFTPNAGGRFRYIRVNVINFFGFQEKLTSLVLGLNTMLGYRTYFFGYFVHGIWREGTKVTPPPFKERGSARMTQCQPITFVPSL